MSDDSGNAAISAANASTATATDRKALIKPLQKENKVLRAEVRKLDQQVKHVEAELTKSNAIKERLENLCRELQRQNKFIKTESSSKLQEAHEKGKQLAVEVQNNMGFMKSINDNLSSITTENMKVRHENEELNAKIDIIKTHYEKREGIIQNALKETTESCIAAQTELDELKLKNAEEKEKLYVEMQQLASALVSTREQMKEAKTTELQLRELLQSYESKFNELQKCLKETNGAYQSFRSEMGKVTKKTKELEADAVKWRKRWEESKESFAKVEKNKQSLEVELKRSNEGLTKMKELCRALQEERKQMLKELKDGSTGKENKEPVPVPAEGSSNNHLAESVQEQQGLDSAGKSETGNLQVTPSESPTTTPTSQ